MPKKRQGKKASPDRERERKREAAETANRRLFDAAKRIPQHLADLDDAVAQRPRLLGPALADFAQRRDQAARETSQLLPIAGWQLLALVPATDHLRQHLGGDWSFNRVAHTWPKLLFEAIDEAVSALWMSRSGNTVGATLIARTLLERWTLNVAHHHHVERGTDEDEAAFMSRTWSVYAESGVPDNVGDWWGWLSEVLHGRPAGNAFGEALAAPLDLRPEQNVEFQTGVVAVIDLVLRQVRGGLTLLARDSGLDNFTTALQTTGPAFVSFEEPPVIAEGMRDLDFFECASSRAQGWVEIAQIYHAAVEKPDGRLDRQADAILTVESCLERRGRAVQRARSAFAAEAQTTGESFDPRLLAAKLFRYSTISEMARLLAEEATGPERAALVAAAEAQRAATHFWLEDSDYSVGCLRVMLEQTARLRAHRRHPARAAALELRTRSSASRWMEAAGWRRLAPFVRAINEFAHLTFRTRRNGAREVLTEMQLNGTGIETSRGSALDEVTYMLAFELHARLQISRPTTALAFTTFVTLVDEEAHARRLETFLNVGLAQRSRDFGEPDYRPFTDTDNADAATGDGTDRAENYDPAPDSTIP